MTDSLPKRGGPYGRRSVAEIEATLNSLQAEAARASNPRVVERRTLYAAAAAGVLADLAELGYHVEGVGRIAQRGVRYQDAIPVLIHWLPRVKYLPLLQDMLRTLSAPFARRQVVPLFLELFQSPPDAEDPLWPVTSGPMSEDLRFTIGAGLAGFASPAIADPLIEFALDRKYGLARSQIVRALSKTKDPRVPQVLLSLLDDPPVAAYAIEALGKMKWANAVDSITALVDHEDWNTRTEARKALKRLQAAAGSR